MNATPSAASAPAGEAPAASQVGTPKARTKLGRVKLKVSRKRTKLVAKGSARGRTSVRVQAFRYDEENGEFDSSAAYTATVAVDAAGRFSQTFRATALRQGTWRFSVVAEGDADSSTASSRVS